MEFISAQEAAQTMGVTVRRVQQMCLKGEFNGAYKQGKSWLVPKNAVKSAVIISDSKALPIGVSSFKRAVADYFYVDKTLFIKDIIDSKPQVILFTRPRRFGKTLNMDMLRTFFEKTDEDTSVYFKRKKIWDCGEQYRRYQGKYPVIYLSFKDVKFSSWKDALEKLKALMQDEFARRKAAAENADLEEHERVYFKKILDGTATEVELANSLAALTKILYSYYKIAPIVIIDEYDTPILQGYLHNYYEKAVSFLRNFFSGGLKDNEYLSFGFLAGVVNVGQESVFDGMNNIISDSILDDKFNKYFGFTQEEVWDLLCAYEATNKFSEICEWYDGYNFGGQEIFNPWSILSYIGNACRPRSFWQATGSNDFLGELVVTAQRETKENFGMLLQGQSLLTYVDTNVKLSDVKKNTAALYSFLAVFGYLKATVKGANDGDRRCIVTVPDKEVFTIYSKEIISRLDYILPQVYAASIQQAVWEKNFEHLQAAFRDWLMRTISNNDAMNESYYRGFVLCLSAAVGNRYRIQLDVESHEGRFGVCMYPRVKDFPAIFIEIKEGRQQNDNLSDLAKTAIQRIDQKQYDVKMRKNGVERIFKYGIAFSGKNVALVSVK